MHVIQKCAMSLDGFIDDTSPERLLLSNGEDFDRVDAVRAECDAILVGAGTIRADNPRLLVRSTARQQDRLARGLPAQPFKVTLTQSGILDPAAQFFTLGDGLKIVYCPETVQADLQTHLGLWARVVAVGRGPIDPVAVLDDLAAQGVQRLLIEGGSTIATLFLGAGLVDELQVSVAPFFVGEAAAPRFVKPHAFLHHKHQPMVLDKVEQLGNVALLTYRLSRSTVREHASQS
nr:dihydrofolate reductase family protein [Anthocerotibacter panamensis]